MRSPVLAYPKFKELSESRWPTGRPKIGTAIVILISLLTMVSPSRRADAAAELSANNAVSTAASTTVSTTAAAKLFLQPGDDQIEIDGVKYKMFIPSKHPELERLDRFAFQLIFDTNLGRALVRDRFQQLVDANLFTFDIGAPPEVTYPLFGKNPSTYRPQPSRRVTTNDGSQPFTLNPKQYLYLILPENSQNTFPFDSFTLEDNRTLIFVRTRDFSFDKLVRILSHEIAITADQKYNLGSNLQDNESDLEEAAVQRLSFRYVADTFSLMRAFVFEEQVLAEIESRLNVKFPRSGFEQSIASIPKSSERFCQSMVERTTRVMLGYNRLNSEKRAAVLKALESTPNFRVRGSYVALTPREGTRKMESVSPCQYFTMPSLEYRSRTTSGPRPRVSGDW